MVADRQKLEVYHAALAVAAASARLALKIPEPWGDLRDQLRRASTSVALNIAEGAAESRWAEKARFYGMARRAAAECLAVLDIMDRVLPFAPAKGELAADIDRTIAMLTRLIRSRERASE